MVPNEPSDPCLGGVSPVCCFSYSSPTFRYGKKKEKKNRHKMAFLMGKHQPQTDLQLNISFICLLLPLRQHSVLKGDPEICRMKARERYNGRGGGG